VDSKLCKHRFGLLYACVILANRIVEHPKWLTRYPAYKNWEESITKFIPCKSFADLRRILLSELPASFEKLEVKKQ
jgi:hypothetical protein